MIVHKGPQIRWINESAFDGQTFLKHSHASSPSILCLSQEWGVNYANRNKLWHFLLQSFGACDGSLAKKKIIHFCFVLFCIWERFPISNFRFPISNFPAYIRRGDFTEDFLRYEYGGLIFGGAYFRNFTVFSWKFYMQINV